MTEGALPSTLIDVARLLESARDPWWIIGSAAVALHGVESLDVADVDVLLSNADAQRIFPAIGLAVLSGTQHPAFRSQVFGTWQESRLPVEFMAGFQLRQGERWRAVTPATRQAIEVAGAWVFVPDRAELRDLLESFGRTKDLLRARMLDAVG